MRTFFKLIVITILLIGCSPKPNSFSISGTIPSEKNNNAVLYIIENIQENKKTIIDTLQINPLGEFGSVYFLPSAIYELKFEKKTFQLAINNNQHLILNGDNLSNLNISGSIDTDLLFSYETFRKESLNRLVNSVRIKIKNLPKKEENEAKIVELRSLEIENYKKHINELTQFVKTKMGSSIAIYPTTIRWSGEENLPIYSEIFRKFKEEHPKLEITKQLKNKLYLLHKTTVGSIVSSIELPSKNGEIISSNTIKGKVTLIDFWASWCPPCRTESKLLNELYSSYNSKGFEIYGISLDSNKNRWLKALETDQRIWPNVSDLEGFKASVAKEYGITALPTNFLIDNTGKILAVNLHSSELKATIERLFN